MNWISETKKMMEERTIGTFWDQVQFIQFPKMKYYPTNKKKRGLRGGGW